jgi:FAD/FMN-containing dehydrogenase
MSEAANLATVTAADIAALSAVVGESNASTVEDDLRTFGRDWTKVYEPRPSVVLFAKTAAHVCEILRYCDRRSLPVVTSGGRTGLAGGAVATKGEVLLSLSKMTAMDAVDPVGLTLRVQAGAITEAVHQHCAVHGLTWPVDFASKGSSQVGGNIATNAGGVKVIRYGLTRNWVLGLEVVTAQGELLMLNGALEKNNTGTDLRQLFIGSEGTLGVITAATLKLARLSTRCEVLLAAVSSLDGVLQLFSQARKGPFVLNAFEFFTAQCMQRVQAHRKLRDPFEQKHSHYVLIECEATDTEEVENWLGELFEQQLVSDATMAQNSTQARSLWELRESISESLSGTGLPHKNDISLPIKQLRDFCAELEVMFAEHYQDWELCVFGHIGDGNLHINVMKPEAMDKGTFLAQTKEADQRMFALVQKHNGSISAEHGIGLLKRDSLHYSRSPAEIAVLRAVKRALDPKGILNPGKILRDD